MNKKQVIASPFTDSFCNYNTEANKEHYLILDEQYISNGMSPYTIHFLKRMADSSASTLHTHNLVVQCFSADLFTQLVYVCKYRIG
jgi:hypothetical protein